jgi:hypothetical protein
VRTLVESQVLFGEPGAYRLAQPVDTIQVPATVQTTLAWRIDRLAPDERRLLETAAVIGKARPLLSFRPSPRRARRPSISGCSSTADIVPDAERLRIRLHSLANPRSNQALVHLCATLNALALQYPGTTLTLVYEAPGVA